MSLVTGNWFLDALLVGLPLMYWYRRRNFFYWEKLGVPYLKPSSFLCNMCGLVFGKEHIGDPIYECYLEAGDAPFMGTFVFSSPLLMVKDPQLVARILETDFPSFCSRNFAVDPGRDSLLAKSLFGVNEDRWKTLRTQLAPAFTPNKIKAMFSFIDDVAQDLVEYLAVEVEKENVIDVWQVLTRYASHVLCTVVLGTDAGSVSEDKCPLREQVTGLLSKGTLSQLSQAISFLAPQHFSLLPRKFTSGREETFLYLTTIQLMHERRQKRIVRGDVVDMLMGLQERPTQAKKRKRDIDRERKLPGNVEIDDETLVANIVAFLISGLYTSVSTMSDALYELAANQQLQDRVRQDVRQASARHGGDLTYEALAAMTELDNAIDETMRLHPPIRFLDRRVTQPFQLPGSDVVLPRGTPVVVSVLGLHHDPQYWDQPERFNPDRFNTSGSGKGRPSYTFLPFGDGPRQCIGLRVAQMQMKIGLAYVLRNFRVGVTEKTPVPPTAARRKLMRRPKEEFLLSFEKIS